MSLCACGCGQPTRIAPRTRAADGWVKGQPLRYVHGHNGRRPLKQRFWEKVTGGDIETCWEWQGGTDGHGYGQLKIEGGMAKAHRVAWTLLRGDIPDGLVIDHLCYTTLCQNPWHMELVTPAENSRRARANQHKGKTHCHRGHEFTPDNTRLLAHGRRQCRTCERINTNSRRALQRAA